MNRGAEHLKKLSTQATPLISNLLLAAQAHKDKRPYGAAGYAIRDLPSLVDIYDSMVSLVNWSVPQAKVAVNEVKRSVHLSSGHNLTGYWREKGRGKESEMMIVHDGYGFINLYMPSHYDNAIATGLAIKDNLLTKFWMKSDDGKVDYTGYGYSEQVSFTYIETGKFTDIYYFVRA